MEKIRKDIYNKLKTIVDDYRKNDVSSINIKRHFNKNRNFKILLNSLNDLKWAYDKEKEEDSQDFVEVVKEILFNRILMDRIYHEKDNPIIEKLDSTILYDMIASKIAIETNSVEDAYRVSMILCSLL